MGRKLHSELKQKEQSALGGLGSLSVCVCGGGEGSFFEDPGDDAQETTAHRKPPATLTIFFHFILRF